MGSRVKCLLVDDLEENLLAMSALLESDDVELLLARSGFEALELLLVNDVALAFLDVQMPEMDGFQLAELMRGSERSRQVPIIFVTAGNRDPFRLFKGYEIGAVDFLYKPVDPYILKNKADVFFQLYRQKQQLANDLQERTETLRLNEMFTAVLGHDLRSPLQAILLSAELLQRTAADDNARKISARMLSGGKRMQRMIEDLLDLSRMRLGGGVLLQRERLDLGTLMQRVVQEQQSAFPARRIELRQNGELNGDWDADRLIQVASNLLGNALQHGHSGEPVRIVLDGRQPEEVVLCVVNAGRIPPEVLPTLFDPFRGGDRPNHRSGGLGLGLYIVQQIVNAHGGRVEVQSEDSNQTLFRVRIPR